MSTAAVLDALRKLPDSALVPVSWIRPLIEETARHRPTVGLTVEEVSGIVGRSPSTVRSWCSAGKFPGAFRLGGREWRVPREALDSLRNGSVRPESSPSGERLPMPAGGLQAWRRVK